MSHDRLSRMHLPLLRSGDGVALGQNPPPGLLRRALGPPLSGFMLDDVNIDKSPGQAHIILSMQVSLRIWPEFPLAHSPETLVQLENGDCQRQRGTT